MIKIIDNFLNSITMYRLVLYVLVFFVGFATFFSFLKLLPFSPLSLFLSVVLLTIICWVTNKILAYLFKAPVNVESFYITALILSLIITPIRSFKELPLFIIVSVLAIASKYFFAIRRKHLFNPAALAVFLSFYLFQLGASWWVGNLYMLIPVLIGGLLVVRKVRRFNLVLTFLIISLISIGKDLSQFLPLIVNSPILFFAFIMLTEPQTTPPGKKLQILYGGLVGLGFFFLTPEASLLLGNIFSYLFSPKDKLLLKLKQKLQIGPDTYEFIFAGKGNFFYQSGQYMEWTLPHSKPDSRGVRRYFTLASSPEENELIIGIKFYKTSSTFKKTLMSLKKGETIVAANLAGEFILPQDPSKKLAFLAGGIGITPMRSMIKYLLDTMQTRDIILFYSNKTAKDIVYKNIFAKAKKFDLKAVYINTEKDGYLNKEIIKQNAPDYKDRIFYLSGPHSMVDTFEKILIKDLRIPRSQIKTDFFPGYA